jgi:two-component sensor histidine kinase
VLERGLAHELNGSVKMDYRPEGLVCTLELPAPEDIRDE